MQTNESLFQTRLELLQTFLIDSARPALRFTRSQAISKFLRL
ncbi:hypothetical protein LMG29542_07751 [Paraburkholderia humisilvae]|uniref:Uncharacterized protein n=1 Tax=Paraburkholderia humisilvae TaxID=627669 RepID=A0A6J5F9Q2_9BURK|nr:hypothetical protein LMG29542_07751 [Paraburkholderia humisilvae]